ncbi:hypothetical protein [Pseudomonas sp. PLMAX]|uniref:hypothetical protein n=1 Tax=Pseudomonas sp. PLMAX TaxID=2201998 RepID=UPI0038BABA19
MEALGICFILFMAVVIPCCGLWMAGFRVGSVVVGVMVTLGLAMIITGIGRSFFFKNDWYAYHLTHQSVTLGGGMFMMWYAVVILRHMLFSETMPWAGEHNKKSEKAS